MADIIQNIINNTLGDGARSTKFRCSIHLPSSLGKYEKELDVLCKASSFPGKTTEIIDYKHKGKSIPLPGQEKFEQQWELTFYLEENHKSRVIFENWITGLHHDIYSSKANPVITSVQKSMSADKSPIIGAMQISQLNFEMSSEVIKYNFYNVFPMEISNIQTASDGISEMLEYNVTFSFSHYDVVDTVGADNANDIAEMIRKNTQGIVNDGIGAAKNLLADTDFVKSVDRLAGEALDFTTSSAEKVTTNIKNFLG